MGLGLCVAVMSGLFALETVAGWLAATDWMWLTLDPVAYLRAVWLAPPVNAAAAIGEEALFRGYLVAAIDRTLPRQVALGLMAVPFVLPQFRSPAPLRRRAGVSS